MYSSDDSGEQMEIETWKRGIQPELPSRLGASMPGLLRQLRLSRPSTLGSTATRPPAKGLARQAPRPGAAPVTGQDATSTLSVAFSPGSSSSRSWSSRLMSRLARITEVPLCALSAGLISGLAVPVESRLLWSLAGRP